ncbi:MAG: hypothetical protein COV91_00255 [Candidatus Taylorbacteria bacterium CG11_big_fil_rev_8_21_14_0_20_46_11]|uniref:Uncharacterized protein n=1 Tax=Candidatus Taylorbacteria bacterium CG11_big_fil_rev_8_21_14_0_20_46_11 TaxID=1975025 RepID=A0A2H0KEZ5_9BACT|nr:MAG: hypothetical protein COV91_00255 [Candidatus Taylorbacteria bacterium CG11_big_fil_rev_8_21_14_0_20_46_11]
MRIESAPEEHTDADARKRAEGRLSGEPEESVLEGAPPVPVNLETPDGVSVEEAEEVARERRFADMLFRRDMSEKVDVELERERVPVRLDAVRDLAKEVKKKATNGDEKSLKDIPHIEKVVKALENDVGKIDLAVECNDALEELHKIKRDDSENFEAIMNTGKDKNGHDVKLRGKHGKSLDLNTDQLKHVAGLAHRGINHVSWGDIGTLYQVADKILQETIISTAKRFLNPTK